VFGASFGSFFGQAEFLKLYDLLYLEYTEQDSGWCFLWCLLFTSLCLFCGLMMVMTFACCLLSTMKI
jgi:hypothetical protein